ncbi:MAG: hypothetical protein MZW92_11315 [Comamonadaceae bacterium]|nr:hypothetical protein [Comamonadaceae bacterium]
MLTVEGSLAAPRPHRRHRAGAGRARRSRRARARLGVNATGRCRSAIGKYEILRKLGEGATSDRSTSATTPSPGARWRSRSVFPEVLQRRRARQACTATCSLNEASLAGKLQHPAHRADLRRGGRRRAALHRHGVRRRRHARSALPAPSNLLPVERVVEIVFKCSARARLRPPPRRHPPRHQAGQHPAHRRRHRHQDLRLRRGADRPRRRPHAGRRRRLARPTCRRSRCSEHAARPPDRHLLARRGDVPVADRRACRSRRPTTTA